jgi:dolichyl-phosphate-mannose-protein mannosyltransferase
VPLASTTESRRPLIPTSASASRAATAGLLAICALLLSPTLTYRMETDHGVFAYMGAAILDGRWPYLQTWESDFPGLMWLQAAEIALLGRSMVMFRMFDLACQLASVYCIWRIALRLTGDAAGGVVAAVMFCLVYQGYGSWNTAQREGFGLVFVLCGFLMQFTSERRPDWATAAGIGLTLGIAATIKPTLLALAAFHLPAVVRWIRRSAWTALLAAFLGFAAPVALVIGVYWLLGGLRQMYEACIAYQTIYTARLRGSDALPTYWLHKFSRLGTHAIVLPLVYVPFLALSDRRVNRLALLLAYVGSVYAVFVQGTFAGYHYIPGLGVGSILIGDMYAAVSRAVLGGRTWKIGTRRLPIRLAVAGLLAVVLVPVYMRRSTVATLVTLRFLGPPSSAEFRNATVFDLREDLDVASYLREHTRPDDPVQIWGYESLVYYLAERYASSRFQMTHPLVMRPAGGSLTAMQQRWRSEFLSDVRRRPPVYVAVVRGDNWWWAPEERTSEQLLDDFPEWKMLIERDYRLEQQIGRFSIYRRADASG